MAAARSARLRPSTLHVTVVGQPAGRAAAGLGRWLERLAPPTASGEVVIALVSDTRMRVLNRTFRGKDTPTDVLSFQSEVLRPESRGRATSPMVRGSRSPARRRTAALRGAHAEVPGTPDRRARRATPGPGTQDPGPYLGDLAIALGLARRQADEFGHSLRTELKILALHGLLHLFGYDHERDGGAMRRLEERLRRKAGLPTGLIARVPRVRRRSR